MLDRHIHAGMMSLFSEVQITVVVEVADIAVNRVGG